MMTQRFTDSVRTFFHRFEHRGIVPTEQGFHYAGEEFVHHSKLPHRESAFHRFSLLQVGVVSAIISAVTVSGFLNWHTTIVVLVAVLTVLYFFDLLFNLFLIIRSFSRSPELVISEGELQDAERYEWPTYTILCPLYKEWEVVGQFVSAMTKMEYPKEKLQVMLLLEEDDAQTIRHVQTMTLPPYVQTVVVPHSKPKTKPKALNYGLQHAFGEFAVIYDAEDIPDPKQLKKAVVAFRREGPKTVCIQAKLNFYNPRQNFLTRVFTAEYALWFDLVLTGLQSIHAPIPLGGTSNHFRTNDLRLLKGWDAFNVTEDCDLGIRLVKQGYRTAIMDSDTMEEANSHFFNWFGQRTRWIKGYIQTYFVHMRNPGDFLRSAKRSHLLTFQLVVGGKVLSMMINPLMWVVTISYFMFRSEVGGFIESFFPTPVMYMGVFSLVFGNFLYMYYYMIGCAKREHDDIMKYTFLVPFYWLMMSIAAWTALWQFLVNPHHWHKTRHGLHLEKLKKLPDVVLPRIVPGTVAG